MPAPAHPLNPAPHKQGETNRGLIRDLHRRPAWLPAVPLLQAVPHQKRHPLHGSALQERQDRAGTR
nr:MAG TPA: hypothetical protein [Caudoviricetes sp.]